MSQEQVVKNNGGKDIHTELAKSSLNWTRKGVLWGIFIGFIGILISVLIGIGIIAPPGIVKTEKEQVQTNDTAKQTVQNPGSRIEPENYTPTTVSKRREEIKHVNPIEEKGSPITDNKKEAGTEDLSGYINYSANKNDIGVLVIDKDNRPMNTFSSEIATLYRNKGRTVTTSLFTNEFFSSAYLNSVISANSKVLDKLGLASQVNYIVVAKYSNAFEPGELTPWISRATLEVSIISCVSRSQADGFPIEVSSGHFDKQNAERGAKEKILSAYKASHLNL
jgi:hypothetical protein